MICLDSFMNILLVCLQLMQVKAGEFYTPHEVSLLMSEIIANHLKDKREIQIYDPTSGSGSLLINIGKSVAKHIDNVDNIKYYAQELKQNTYNLTRMNLIMRGIIPSNIEVRNADTLEDDWPLLMKGSYWNLQTSKCRCSCIKSTILSKVGSHK